MAQFVAPTAKVTPHDQVAGVGKPPRSSSPESLKSGGKGEKLEAVFFEKDSGVLNASGKQVLDRVTTLLNSEDYRGFQSITLIGFSSSEGELDHNEKLSMERTQAVKNHLVEKGLPDQRIVVAPLGQADKGNPEDRNPEMNRRVEILVVR
jgi:OOP family OmpA-OmpF porin